MVFLAGYYFISKRGSGIWKKNQDAKSPELWDEIPNNNCYAGRQLKAGTHPKIYSLFSKVSFNSMVGYELNEYGEKLSKFDLVNDFEEDILDFVILDHSSIFGICTSGLYFQFELDFKQRERKTLNKSSLVKRKLKAYEKILGIEKGPHENYLIVSSYIPKKNGMGDYQDLKYSGQKQLMISSRLFVLRVEKTGLSLFHTVSLEHLCLFLKSVKVYGFIQNKMILSCLNYWSPSYLVTFQLDVKTKNFMLIEDLNTELDCKFPERLIHLEKRLVGLAREAKKIEIDYKVLST